MPSINPHSIVFIKTNMGKAIDAEGVSDSYIPIRVNLRESTNHKLRFTLSYIHPGKKITQLSYTIGKNWEKIPRAWRPIMDKLYTKLGLHKWSK